MWFADDVHQRHFDDNAVDLATGVMPPFGAGELALASGCALPTVTLTARGVLRVLHLIIFTYICYGKFSESVILKNYR